MAFKKREAEKLLVDTGRRCCICGCLHDVSLHHIVPQAEGGTHEIDNATPLCPNCHNAVHGSAAPGRTTKAYTPGELKRHRQRTIELTKVQNGLTAQEGLRGILPDEEIETTLASLRDREAALKAQLYDVAIGGDLKDSTVITGDNNSITHIVNHYVGGDDPAEEKDRLRQQIASYLRWVREHFGTIELRGIKREGQQVVQLDLQTVYVPLEAEVPGEDAGHREIGFESLLSLRAPRPMDALRLGPAPAPEPARRLAVTGGPGSGKTTVLQHIAWTLATAVATDKPDLARDKLGLDGPLPLPMFVSLSEYAEFRRNLPRHGDPRERTLAAFVSRRLIERQNSLGLPSDFFARLLTKGEAVILLLDGLDEVPNEDERAAVRQAIEDLVDNSEDLRVVVTCRTAAYQDRTALGKSFCEVRVKPLEDEHVQALVRQAYGAIHRHDPTAVEAKGEELLRGIARLEEDRELRLGEDADRLITSPLLVRMLLVVHFSERQLPEQRTELYMKATDAMLLPEYGPDDEVANRIGRLVGGSRERHRELVQHLAFAMHQRGPTQGREIAEHDLREELAKNPAHRPMIDDLIELTRLRGTLLEERLGTYRFIHLAFQEYLIARYLAEVLRGEEAILDFLQSGPVLDSWWREPILLLIGYLSTTSPQIAESFLRRLVGLGVEPKKPPASDVQLACAELAGIGALEWRTSRKELRDELAARLAAIFRDRAVMSTSRPPVRAAAGNALARLGDPRFRADTFYLPDAPLLGFVEIPASTFLMGSDKHRDPRARDAELPQHQVDLPTYYLARYPVTVAQFRAFVEDSKYEPEDSDCLRGIANHPVVWVSWDEAVAYCEWIEQHLLTLAAAREGQTEAAAALWQGLRQGSLRVTLPSEAEWEKAARGTKGPIYPWGEKPDPSRANYDDTGIDTTSAVGCFPAGASPYGCQDMSGNVWEWTRSASANYPYRQAEDARKEPEDASASPNRLRVLRGGAFHDLDTSLRCACRSRYFPHYRFRYIGFRLCVCPHF